MVGEMKMKRVTVLLLTIFGLISCLPEGYYPATTAGITDYWILESGEITETLDLYFEKGRYCFTWTRQIQGVDIVDPVKGHYNVRRVNDYGEKWYVLTLMPEGENQPIYSYKMTLSQDKRVLALEGSGISYYYRVEKEKNAGKDDGEKK